MGAACVEDASLTAGNHTGIVEDYDNMAARNGVKARGQYFFARGRSKHGVAESR